MALPKVGVELVAKGAAQAQQQIASFNKSMSNLGVSSQKAATAATQNLGVFSRLSAIISKNAEEAGKSSKAFELLGDVLGVSGDQAKKMAIGFGIAAAAVGALYFALKGLNALGKSGVAFEQISSVFSGTLGADQLSNLRAQTKGTISDLDLMRMSLKAVQGTSQATRKELEQNLGNVFYKTGLIAQATGQQQEAVQEKLLEGIKEQSAEQLKSFGIIIDQQQAYANYAKSIDKPVSALTNLEKQAAFTREAIKQFNASTAGLKGNEAANNMNRITASLSNLRTTLGTAILPIYKTVLGATSGFLNALVEIAKPIGSIFSSMFSVIAQVANETWGIIKSVFGAIGIDGKAVTDTLWLMAAAASIAAETIGIALSTIAKMARAAIQAFIGAFKPVIGIVKSVFGGINKTALSGVEQLAYMLGYGGGFVVGSFAKGLMSGAKYVLKAVNFLAGIVADFLMGFSPPKKGILHDIEQGASNVALAWASGFTKSILAPVDEISKAVNDRLGAIGNMGRDQIEARFKALDEAIRPYKESISIIKADMDAIMKFVDPALRVVERQRVGILKAFEAGKGGDIDQLRNLDRQNEGLNKLKQSQENRLDMANMELALAEASQAQERALLEIQKARLGVEEQITDQKLDQEKAQKEISDKALEAKAGGGSALEQIAAGGAGFSFDTGAAGGGFDGLAAAKAQLGKIGAAGAAGVGAGFSASGAAGELAALGGEKGKLQATMSKINGADPVGKIAAKFSGLATALTQPLADMSKQIEDTFNRLFVGDESVVSRALNSAKEKFNSIFASAEGIMSSLFSFDTILGTFFGEGEESTITRAKNGILNALNDISNAFNLSFMSEDSLFKQAMNAFNQVMGFNFFSEDSVVMKAYNAVKSMIDNTVKAFSDMFIGTGEGSLSSVLSTFKEILRNVIVAPAFGAMQAAANSVIDVVRSAVREFNKVSPVDIGEPSPISLSIPNFAKGGLGINSPFIAGERGAELIVPSRNNPLDIFPASATSALERIAAMPVFGNQTSNSTVNNNTNSNTTFNVNSPAQAMLISRQRAAMRSR